MSGFVVIMTALVAGVVGGGVGLGVAYVFLQSRNPAARGPMTGVPAPRRDAAAPNGDPAAQANHDPAGDQADDDEEDESIPTTVFRAEDLDLDALIEQAERLKSRK